MYSIVSLVGPTSCVVSTIAMEQCLISDNFTEWLLGPCTNGLFSTMDYRSRQDEGFFYNGPV